MILITGPRTLDKGKTLRFLVVSRTQDLALGGAIWR